MRDSGGGRRSSPRAVNDAIWYNSIESALALAVSFIINLSIVATNFANFSSPKCAEIDDGPLACLSVAAFNASAAATAAAASSAQHTRSRTRCPTARALRVAAAAVVLEQRDVRRAVVLGRVVRDVGGRAETRVGRGPLRRLVRNVADRVLVHLVVGWVGF